MNDEGDHKGAPPPPYRDFYNNDGDAVVAAMEDERPERPPPSYDSTWNGNGGDNSGYPDEKKGGSGSSQQEGDKKAKECSHWRKRGCSMTSGPRVCCACLDNRPVAPDGRYQAYVDGQGFKMNAARWSYYCPGCKKAERRARKATTEGSAKMTPKPTAATATAPQIQMETTKTSEKAEKGECPHWRKRGCAMTSGPRACCTCLDQRPLAPDGLYMEYVDGQQLRRTAVRWAHYCADCRRVEGSIGGIGRWRPEETDEELMAQAQQRRQQMQAQPTQIRTQIQTQTQQHKAPAANRPRQQHKWRQHARDKWTPQHGKPANKKPPTSEPPISEKQAEAEAERHVGQAPPADHPKRLSDMDPDRPEPWQLPQEKDYEVVEHHVLEGFAQAKESGSSWLSRMFGPLRRGHNH